jgi:hypothetical protein
MEYEQGGIQNKGYYRQLRATAKPIDSVTRSRHRWSCSFVRANRPSTIFDSLISATGGRQIMDLAIVSGLGES